MTLTDFNKSYEEIIHSNISGNRKAIRLADLLTAMEHTFKIPMLRNDHWEQQNKAIISLYRKISISRNL
ncbi:hypothetical protein [Mesobacillus jeotgali]|uniref:hypothetical protein n=1 Tax=Mesobacillus jeotgali TaxID=129985 RepID=UPI000C865EEA|nr:hypothetical protein [Mesobacillus jeotgali]